MIPLPADPRREKIKTLAQYQMYCVIPIVVLNVLPHGHPIDAQHARNSALFHLFATIACVLGIIALEVKKYGSKKALAADDAEARRQNPGSTPGVWPPPPLP